MYIVVIHYYYFLFFSDEDLPDESVPDSDRHGDEDVPQRVIPEAVTKRQLDTPDSSMQKQKKPKTSDSVVVPDAQIAIDDGSCASTSSSTTTENATHDVDR